MVYWHWGETGEMSQASTVKTWLEGPSLTTREQTDEPCPDCGVFVIYTTNFPTYGVRCPRCGWEQEGAIW